MYRYSTILEIYTGTVVPYYIRSISVQYSILPAYCIRYTIAYSTCDLFLEIAATAATVIRSDRSVLVVMRQFVVRQSSSTYSRKDKAGGISFSSHPPLPYYLVNRMVKLRYVLSYSMC